VTGNVPAMDAVSRSSRWKRSSGRIGRSIRWC